jgi:hypothetical protein
VGDEREPKAYLGLLMVRTETFVRTPMRWMQIEAIAKALMKKRPLAQENSGSHTPTPLGGPFSLKQA